MAKKNKTTPADDLGMWIYTTSRKACQSELKLSGKKKPNQLKKGELKKIKRRKARIRTKLDEHRITAPIIKK